MNDSGSGECSSFLINMHINRCMNNDTGSGEPLVLNKHTHQPCIHLYVGLLLQDITLRNADQI